MAHHVQGVLAQYRSDFEGTVTFEERATAPLRETGLTIWILSSIIELGISQLYAGRTERAVTMLDEVIALAHEASAEAKTAMGLTYRGHTRLAQEDPALAARMFDEERYWLSGPTAY